MEKLLDLLNEYEKENENADYRWKYWWRIEWKYIICENLILGYDEQIDTGYSIICSKWYGFIERLVKNDKIDFKTFGNAFWTKYLEYPIWSDNYDQVYDYEDIIKWLAISDTPIEDLIYYLK